MSDYCAVVMLYLFNPMIDSLRSLQRTLGLGPVAKILGVKRFSLGSFSESVRVFDPQRLKAIVQELAGELTPLGRVQKGSGERTVRTAPIPGAGPLLCG
jgi:hypothetical protein